MPIVYDCHLDEGQKILSDLKKYSATLNKKTKDADIIAWIKIISFKNFCLNHPQNYYHLISESNFNYGNFFTGIYVIKTRQSALFFYDLHVYTEKSEKKLLSTPL